MKNHLLKIALIGETSLLIACAEYILKNKEFYEILFVCTPNIEAINWCKKNNIKYVTDIKEFEKHLKQISVDYLFSIVNYQFLSSSLRHSIKQQSINYHDSLLPSYAGVNATSWAIFNNERNHGITWHIVTDQYDAGDILEQDSVIIDVHETTLSLNMKCYEAALHGFKDLLKKILRNKLIPIKQNLKNRSYYGYRTQLPLFGIIDWNDTAENIALIIRSCTFGNYPNRFGSAKLIIDNDIYYIKHVEVIKAEPTPSSIGRIIALEHDALVVGTSSNFLKVLHLIDEQGNLIYFQYIIKKYKLKIGQYLPALSKRQYEQYKENISAVAVCENHWLQQFLNAEPLRLPSSLVQEYRSSISFSLSSLGLSRQEELIALFYIYIYRLTKYDSDATFIGLTSHQEIIPTSLKILGNYRPLRLNLTRKEKFSDLVNHIDFIKKENSRNKNFMRDMFIRYPEFQNVDIGLHLFPPVIIHTGDVASIPWHETSQLVIGLTYDQKECTVIAKLTQLELKAMLKRLKHLANYIQNDQSVFQHPLLTEKEYRQIILNWNKTKASYPENKTISLLFEEQVNRTPNNIALIYGDKKFTYAQLNENANQVAHYLIAQYNVKQNDLIILCLERNENLMIALLGVLKLGATYVPIDPEYPTERIRFVLKDTKAKILLTNQRYAAELTKKTFNQSVSIVAIDNASFLEQLSQQNKTNVSRRLKSNSVAYVIYTSGTTGEPKGVMIEHKGIVNRIKWMNDEYPLVAEDKILQKTPYTFDVSVWELFWANWYGASIVLAKPNGHKDSNYIAELIEKECITIVHFVPSMLSVFTDTLQKKLPHLRRIFCSGEALNLMQVKRCQKTLPSIKIHNLYGPTEASIDVLAYDCSDENIREIYIGKPIYNTSCYILDNHMMPLPLNVTGELYIGGIGVARGYLNNPTLTASRFIKNPFQTQEEKRKNINGVLYKTGDLAKWLPNRNIQYMGRCDFQVKIRGHRVELEEIEAIFSQYPKIKECAVVVKKRDDSVAASELLVGYYTAKTNIDETNFLNYLQRHLSDYMIPTFLIRLEHFPLTHNGKLNRKILIQLKLPDIKDNNYISPKTDLEKNLCEIWSKILGLPYNNIGIHDSFFKLGGDSILAIRLVGALNEKFSYNLKIQHLYSANCISELVKLITAKNEDTHIVIPNYEPFSLVNKESFKDKLDPFNLIEDIYPASYLQTGMLIESAIDRHGTYHDVFIYPIKAEYDEEKFLSIWRKLIQKHALLRTSFHLTNQGFYNVAHKNTELNLVSHINQDCNQLILNERLNKFDFSKPGLFRILINKSNDNDFELIFSFHHAIADGWSVASLMQEFIEAYINGKEILQTINLNYGEFVKDELLFTKNELTISFWENYLCDKNIAKAKWKSDNNKSDNSLYILKADLNQEQVNLVHQIVKKLGISADTVFLSAYFKMLSHFLNSNDLAIGLVVNNRLEKAHSDKAFGLFLNTIPFNFNFSNYSSELNALLNLFNNKIDLQKHQKLPYGYIKKRFKSKSYDFSFNFIHFHILNEHLKELDSFVGYERTSIPFTLNVFQRSTTHFCIKMVVHDDYIDKDFLNAVIQCYINNLNATLNSVSASVLSEINKDDVEKM